MSPAPLNEAIAHHQRGELDQAIQLYRQILTSQPDQPDALHLLGVAALQRGQPKQAIELIERAIALEPSQAAYHANLAEAYRAVGQPQRAISCCQIALRLQPVYPECANNFGSLLMQTGQPAEAVKLFQLAVEQRPDFALAHNNLGNACRVVGDIEKSLTHFRRAVELNPQMGFAHGNLGQLLLECDRAQEALQHCREAVRLQPQSAPACNNLGNVFRKLGQFREAKACYAEAMRLAPNLAMVHHNLGDILQQENKADEARKWYEQALQLEPNSARFHTSLANLLLKEHDSVAAEAHLRAAVAHEPRFLEGRLVLAKLRADQGRLEEAQTELQTVLRSNPNHPAINCQLGEVLLELNQPQAALACYRTALRANPSSAMALTQIASHFPAEMSAEDHQTLHRQLADPALPDTDRVQILFCLAQMCDGRGEYERAAEHLAQANSLEFRGRQQRGESYNGTAHVHFVERLMTLFTPEFFGRVRGLGADSERPIFIVGLPRSGTTLLEQVLASHSRVFGAGELRLAREGFEKLGRGPDGISEERAFAALENADAPTLRGLAEDYLGKLQGLNADAARVTDKMPDNYQYLGLLAALFPRARFLHCRRDLRDVAVSCWITQFRQIPWANDAEEIASRFTQYRRLMDHWERVLPVPVFQVDYEDMVGDLEEVSRRVLDFCDLEWEPACLAFHHNKRPVRTASVTQVRQPIYRRSLARWKNYETALQPLFSRLEGSSTPSDQLQPIG